VSEANYLATLGYIGSQRTQQTTHAFPTV